MVVITVAKARASFELLMGQVAESHEPALILGKRANAVLVSAEDWDFVQQQLNSTSAPHHTVPARAPNSPAG
jgi:PHD/YefM family antitoxin component YafN of YafNO toxin-antitoxin module